MKPNIEIHIEELVLHGFPAGDRYLIGGAAERELVRLFEEQEMPPSLSSGGDFDRLDAGKFEVQPNAKPEKVASRIAQAVYKGFGK